ncbi:hypothetical protein BJV82DRAFT_505051 [Fennellomyces sp. T-0311]|nr:hypothetical protein BJV82DRAFT_505051 [Fennellomyces sp. T-0311]
MISNTHTHPNSFADRPQDLERALAMQTSDLLDDLLGSFLSNVLNRKKPLDKQYVKELSKLINSKGSEIDLDRNPFQKASSFGVLSASVKLRILCALVDWQLQDSNAVRSLIDTAPKASPFLRAEPIGVDAERRTYWHFGGT